MYIKCLFSIGLIMLEILIYYYLVHLLFLKRFISLTDKKRKIYFHICGGLFIAIYFFALNQSLLIKLIMSYGVYILTMTVLYRFTLRESIFASSLLIIYTYIENITFYLLTFRLINFIPITTETSQLLFTLFYRTIILVMLIVIGKKYALQELKILRVNWDKISPTIKIRLIFAQCCFIFSIFPLYFVEAHFLLDNFDHSVDWFIPITIIIQTFLVLIILYLYIASFVEYENYNYVIKKTSKMLIHRIITTPDTENIDKNIITQYFTESLRINSFYSFCEAIENYGKSNPNLTYCIDDSIQTLQHDFTDITDLLQIVVSTITEECNNCKIALYVNHDLTSINYKICAITHETLLQNGLKALRNSEDITNYSNLFYALSKGSITFDLKKHYPLVINIKEYLFLE